MVSNYMVYSYIYKKLTKTNYQKVCKDIIPSWITGALSLSMGMAELIDWSGDSSCAVFAPSFSASSSSKPWSFSRGSNCSSWGELSSVSAF